MTTKRKTIYACGTIAALTLLIYNLWLIGSGQVTYFMFGAAAVGTLMVLVVPVLYVAYVASQVFGALLRRRSTAKGNQK